ncbi:MAG: DUF262 domain-containing protein [Deltaproteobacteria bacterium]|nr:DUF262 domain-containing protein [Deltaproteobacteria bacterium]
MSYETAKIIAEIIEDIHRKKYLLPSIQREFIWTTYQIERLFDSLMRDYPIGSFLFWKVQKDKVKDYAFYELLREYHERDNTHNPKANVSGDDEITAILDGQQRLTSLYVGLKGSYAYKLPRKRWDNDLAFPRRELFLNLLNKSDDPEFEYAFKFLTDIEAENNDEDHFWFKVGDILDMKELSQVNSFLIRNGIFDTSRYDPDQSDFANNALSKLYNIIHMKPTISYFLEHSEKLDKVLNIFIRINSGGTELSYSDLLLSIASAQWEEKDARDEIINFVDDINAVGDGFNFNKDFVLKTCLVLSDIKDIAFKVDNFNKLNMLKIERNWDDITQAIRLSVNLAFSFGYNRETLTSNNALIPIAYYLKKIGLPRNFTKSTNTTEDRRTIQRWLLLSLLKRAFSGQPDNVLRPIRKILNESDDGFPQNKIVDHFKGTNKTIVFSEEDIDSLVDYKYGQSFTFSVMCLLYPSFDFRNKFHVDHIFPRSFFTYYRLKKRGISEDKINTYLLHYNYLGNLQFLEDIPNIEKQDMDFHEWLDKICRNETDRKEYMDKHFIPDVDISFDNFIEFFEEREKLIIAQLRSILLEPKRRRIRRRIRT